MTQLFNRYEEVHLIIDRYDVEKSLKTELALEDWIANKVLHIISQTQPELKMSQLKYCSLAL